MEFIADSNYHMWFVLLVTAAAIYFFAREKYSLEVTSIGILTALLLFGQLFPLPDANGRNQLDAYYLLHIFYLQFLVLLLQYQMLVQDLGT